MMQFFRKYNKTLLAVFMAFLMVVFVGGSALQSLVAPDPRGEVRWNSDFGEITQGNLNDMDVKMKLASAFYPRLPDLQPVDLILLLREAESFGLQPDAAALQAQLPEDLKTNIARFASQQHQRPGAVFQAMAEMETVQKMLAAMTSSYEPTEAELRAAAEEVLRKAKVEAVVLPAKVFVQKDQTFSEAELQAQFEKYRETAPGIGLHFGYVLPPAVKIEYVEVQHAMILDSLQQAVADAKTNALGRLLVNRAERFYKDERATNKLFKKKAEEKQPDEGGADDTKADGEDAAEDEPTYMSWEEARGIALEDVLNKEASKRAERLAKELIRKDNSLWIDQPMREDHYRERPKGVDSSDYYGDLIESLESKYRYPGALAIKASKYFTQDEASEVPGIGGIGGAVGGSNARLRELAFRVEGLATIPDPGMAREFMSLYQTCHYPIKSFVNNNYYVFRVVGTKDSRPAERLDQVRDKVVHDLRTLRGFEAAKEQAHTIREGMGLGLPMKEAFENDGEISRLREQSAANERALQYITPPPFSATSIGYYYSMMQRGATKHYPVSIGSNSVPYEEIQKVFALEGAVDQTTIIELEDNPTVLLVRVLEFEPAREDGYERFRSMIAQGLRSSRVGMVVKQWFDPDSIKARTNAKNVQEEASNKKREQEEKEEAQS